jgi:rare lipoprotein A
MLDSGLPILLSTGMRKILSSLALGLLLAGCGAGAPKLGGPAPAQAAAVKRPDAGGPAIAGHASYYATYFHGRRMANGQRFDMASNSAAHRSLPFGTMLKVTNTANGRSAIVVVRDRGPFTRGRVLDVSPRIAGELGMKGTGVAHVVARPVSRDMVELAEAPQ